VIVPHEAVQFQFVIGEPQVVAAVIWEVASEHSGEAGFGKIVGASGFGFSVPGNAPAVEVPQEFVAVTEI
jgi:hypothetical protein